MKKQIFGCLMSVMFLVSPLLQSENIDAVSSASTKNYYHKISLVGKKLFDELKLHRGAISVATVNADGSPNAAVVIPGVVDEKTLRFGLAPNQTKKNLLERKYAVITFYQYKSGEDGKMKERSGARIVVKTIDDPDTLKKLVEKTKARANTIFVQILKILPLG